MNCSASLAMSTSVLEALPGKLDIKRHSPSILYISGLIWIQTIRHSDGIAKEFFKLQFVIKKNQQMQGTKFHSCAHNDE